MDSKKQESRFPLAINHSRFYFKIECPDDALAIHSISVVDTSLMDKANFIAMTARLEEVVYKQMWKKSNGNYASWLEMRVVVIDIHTDCVHEVMINRPKS